MTRSPYKRPWIFLPPVFYSWRFSKDLRKRVFTGGFVIWPGSVAEWILAKVHVCVRVRARVHECVHACGYIAHYRAWRL